MFKKTLDRIGQLLALKKNKTHYADCVIRDEKGRICLLHRSYQDDFAPGKWCLPGGHIEPGEEPMIAAARELEEETGYKNIPLFYLDKVDRKDSISLYYEGFVWSGTPTLLDNEEHYRIQWVELKDLDNYELLLDLKETLAKLPLSPVPTLPEAAPIGEDLYTSWQNNLTSFDEGKIDELVFFKTVEIHKAVAAYELVTRAFDNDEISPEEFSRVHKVEKAEGFDQVLELAKGTDTEVLEEIVKGGRKATIGEKRMFGGREYIKTADGWKFHGKGTGTKAQAHVTNSSPKEERDNKEFKETLIGEGTQGKVYDIGNDNVKKIYKEKNKGIEEYKKLINSTSKSFVNVKSVDSEKGVVVMEKLDTKSPKLQLLKDAPKILFDVKLDEITIIEEGKESKYIQDRLNKISPKNREKVNQYIDFVLSLDKEGLELGLNIDDIHQGNFGVDKDGNIKMFDFNKSEESDLEITTLNDLEKAIKTAKKDLSHLKKVKKIITRDGKTFLTTVYVKTGEIIEEKEATGTSFAHAADIEHIAVGERISISRKGKLSSLNGEVCSMWIDKLGKAYFALREDGERVPKYISVDSVTYKKVISSTSPSTDEKILVFPKLSDLREVRSLGGSSDVKLMESKHSSDFYALKTARVDKGALGTEQIKEEMCADDIYTACGFNSVESHYYEEGGVGKKLSRIVSGKQLSAIEKSDFEKVRREVQKGFVLDCLLSNWDVIGQSEDNIIWDGKEVHRIDNGGALRFRAKGALKSPTPSAFEVDEIDLLRDSSKNTVAAKWFSGITDEEIARQVEAIDIRQVTAAVIASNIGGKDIVAATLQSRYDVLVEKYGGGVVKVKKTKATKEEYDKTKYSSKVTADYFENGWDSLELEGNAEMKDTIKRNILIMEEYKEPAYERIASSLGVTVEEFKKEFQQLTEQIVAKSDFYIAIHSTESKERSILHKIFNEDGRFKSQFETRTSCGSLCGDSRSHAEHVYFGFENNVTKGKTQRPVYGYWSDHSDGIINEKGTIPPNNYIENYGNISCKVKKDIALKKATITGQDSLGSYGSNTATPASKPHFTSFDVKEASDYNAFKRKVNEVGVSKSTRGSYVEAQYHNQLTIDHIESVHIPINSSDFKKYSGEINLSLLNSTINQFAEFAASKGRSDIQIKIF